MTRARSILTRPTTRAVACAAVACVMAAWMVAPATAQVLRSIDEIPELRGVDLVEQLGQTIPLDVRMTNAQGEVVSIGKYFNDGEKPVVLALVYYRCPVVCTVVLDQLSRSFNDLDYTIGEDFNVVVASFDPTETVSHAYGKKMVYTSGYARGVTPEVLDGWGFHIAESSDMRRLAESVGFGYKLLPSGEYSHPIAVVVLSPDGMVSRYLYGFDYPARDMKLALLDASEGKIAKSIGDRIMQYCYRFDPDAGKYSLVAMRVMRLGGLLTVVGLVALVGGLLIVERVRRSARRSRSVHSSPSAPTGVQGPAS